MLILHVSCNNFAQSICFHTKVTLDDTYNWWRGGGGEGGWLGGRKWVNVGDGGGG